MSVKLGRLTGLYQDALEARRLARQLPRPLTAPQAAFLDDMDAVVTEIRLAMHEEWARTHRTF